MVRPPPGVFRSCLGHHGLHEPETTAIRRADRPAASKPSLVRPRGSRTRCTTRSSTRPFVWIRGSGMGPRCVFGAMFRDGTLRRWARSIRTSTSISRRQPPAPWAPLVDQPADAPAARLSGATSRRLPSPGDVRRSSIVARNSATPRPSRGSVPAERRLLDRQPSPTPGGEAASSPRRAASCSRVPSASATEGSLGKAAPLGRKAGTADSRDQGILIRLKASWAAAPD